MDVRKVSSRFEYFLQIFPAEFVLVLKMLVLDTELNSASNGDVFKGGHRAKRGLSPEILVFDSKYIPLIFTPRLVLVLKVVVLDAELNSTSNADIFKAGHQAKKRGFHLNTGFSKIYSIFSIISPPTNCSISFFTSAASQSQGLKG